MFANHACEGGVLGFRCHYSHVVEVFGSGADERYAAYVYFFYDVGFGSARCHSCFKRIEVDDYQVDGRNFIFAALGNVVLIVAAVENTAEDFRMKSLNATAQNRWVTGKVFYRFTFIAKRFYK